MNYVKNYIIEIESLQTFSLFFTLFVFKTFKIVEYTNFLNLNLTKKFLLCVHKKIKKLLLRIW